MIINKRKLLIFCTLSTLFVGGVLLLIPFGASLLPSKKVISAIPYLDLSAIEKGKYQYLPHPVLAGSINDYKWTILVYRKRDDSIKIWNIPMKNNHVGMPDLHWWKPSYECRDFSPTVVNGLIDEALPIKCNDNSLPSEWWANEWRWDINGNALGTMVDDLQKAKGYQQVNTFVFKH